MCVPIRWRWKCSTVLVLVFIISCQSLEVKTSVDIIPSKLFNDHLLVTCSVISSSAEDLSNLNVYLHCPIIGEDKICYINCANMIVTKTGEPIQNDVFQHCRRSVNRQNRIDYQFLLNNRFIGVTGQWYCAYKNHRSSNITIKNYVSPPPASMTPAPQGSAQESSSGLSICRASSTCPVQTCDATIIAGTICAFCISAICNILLAAVFCVSRCETRRSKRRHLSKDNSYQSPTETLPLFSKISNHQRDLNRSLGSGTPSLDTPSNKESLSTYIADTTIHSNASKANSMHMLPDQVYRIIEVIPRNHGGYNLDHVLPRQNSTEIHSAQDPYLSSVHMRPVDISRLSSQYSCGNYGTTEFLREQIPILCTRNFNSHQQLHHDSNDESGIGSGFLYQIPNHSSMTGSDLLYQAQHNSTFNSRSNKIDLINDCSVNDISTRTSSVDS